MSNKLAVSYNPLMQSSRSIKEEILIDKNVVIAELVFRLFGLGLSIILLITMKRTDECFTIVEYLKAPIP